MRLYWSPRSAFVRLVMITAHELGLAGRIETLPVVVGGPIGHPVLMHDNPLGKIPTLITDDGIVLYDSSVICTFLESLTPSHPLTPTDPAARIPALRLRSLAEGMLDISLQRVSERSRPEIRRSEPLMALWHTKIVASLDVLEMEAAGLGGGPFGVAQIGVGVALGYLDFRFPDEPWRSGRPNLAGWAAGFADRPSARATMHQDAMPL